VVGKAQSAERRAQSKTRHAPCAMRHALSYKTLNKKSNQLAHLLIEKGVKPDHIVALLLERSIEMVIAILGILKAGAAYLPIDPDYPENRINYMLADSGAGILLSEASKVSEVSRDIEVIDLTQPTHPNSPTQPTHLTHLTHPTHLSYIIYTSGTTGKPKGVMIEHRNVVRLMFNDQFQFDFGSSDVWTLFHSYCFDFSVWEMYGALLYGGKLVIIPKMTARDPGAFLKVLMENGVTVLNQTPAAFYQLVDEELKQLSKALHLKYVIFGGEALKPIKLKKWKERYPGTKLINMFGITETTVHVTFKEITGKEIAANESNVGKPIPTLSTYIMDNHQGLLAIGVPGELCVGGAGVGRGYLNRAELTKEKFVENTYKPAERLYRSGDLLKLFADGEMEYLGRIDQQVQVRGFRVELGEIENRLLNHQDIKEVVVREVDKGPGQKHLSAYIVSGKDLEVSGLRSYLSKYLPDYMIPAYFVQLEKIPLTSNGKVDRKHLPQPEVASGQARYVAPKSDMEKIVANTWSEVLELGKVGVRDNFFEIGGNSLSVVRVIGKLRDVLKRDIPVVILFEYPTVDSLAQYLSKDVNDGTLPADEVERADIMDKGKDRRKQRMKKSKEF
jgi:amino acid adenylation domain-containing protein